MSKAQNNTPLISPNGEIIHPVAGTTFWQNGKAVGVWGDTLKIEPMILTNGGHIRKLNALEKIPHAGHEKGFSNE